MDDIMKIVVVSDTHGYNEPLNQVIAREWPFDYMIHCGDIEEDPERLYLDHRVEFGLLVVKGNCDTFLKLPAMVSGKFGPCTIMAVHGHNHHVRSGSQDLLQSARKNHADVVLYGHTHVPEIELDERRHVLIVNPGSLTQNRPFGTPGTYAVLTIRKDGLPKARIISLED